MKQITRRQQKVPRREQNDPQCAPHLRPTPRSCQSHRKSGSSGFLVSGIGARYCYSGLCFDHLNEIGDVLNAIAAESLSSSGGMKHIEIDESPKPVMAGHWNRRETKQIAEPVRWSSLLNEKRLAFDPGTVQQDVCKPEKHPALRIERYLQSPTKFTPRYLSRRNLLESAIPAVCLIARPDHTRPQRQNICSTVTGDGSVGRCQGL